MGWLSVSASHVVGRGLVPMESVSLRSYSDAYPCHGKHPNMNVETQIPLELGHGLASRPGLTKDHHKNGTNCLPVWHACFRGWSLTVQPDCLIGRVVCGTVYGDMHFKRSPGIDHKSRVSYR